MGVQETEHKPKKTHKNAIKGDNKREKCDKATLEGDSIEMLSVPDCASELTLTWAGKGWVEKQRIDK